MKKRFLALTLAAVMAAASFAGCSGEQKDSNDSTVTQEPTKAAGQTPTGGTAATGYNGADNLKISEEPKTVTLFYAFGANGAPTGDSKVWKKVTEITNVTMENTANESISDDLQSLNTMLASNELPDLIQGLRINITPLISQGVYMPLDDLIAEYGPNIQKFLGDYPDAVNAGKGTDGKMYLISGTLGGKPGQTLPSVGYFIRKDWLEKLNLQVPATFEEYKNVLYAFRNNDPNGNGKKDEVPYFNRDGLTGINNILQLWNVNNDFYIGEDDKVHFAEAEDSYKSALTDLTQWYADGIIDPEIFTRGSNARQDLLGNDLGGSTIDWFASTGAVNDTVRELVPDIDFAAIAPPADMNGDVKMLFGRNSLHDYAWGISSTCKDPVTAIKLIDFALSETGSRLLQSGIEGDDYTLENGVVKPTEKALGYETGYPNYLRSIGGGYELGDYGNMEGEKSSMNKQALEGFEMYAASDWIQPQFPKMAFTEEEQKIINDNKTNIDSLVKEYEQSCLLGNQNVADTWDKHIAYLKDMNLQAVLDAYNSAYERYKSGN